jgi:hypothetical protein
MNPNDLFPLQGPRCDRIIRIISLAILLEKGDRSSTNNIGKLMVDIIHIAYLTCVIWYSWRPTMWRGHGYGHHLINLKQGIIFYPNLLKLDVVMKAHEHNDIMHVIGNIKVPHTIECVRHLYVCIHFKELYLWLFFIKIYNHFKIWGI